MSGPPVLYETMLFIDGEEIGSATRRYETKEQAQQGHEDTVHDVESVCESIVKGRTQWDAFGKKLGRLTGLREIAQISQEAGEYD